MVMVNFRLNEFYLLKNMLLLYTAWSFRKANKLGSFASVTKMKTPRNASSLPEAMRKGGGSYPPDSALIPQSKDPCGQRALCKGRKGRVYRNRGTRCPSRT